MKVLLTFTKLQAVDVSKGADILLCPAQWIWSSPTDHFHTLYCNLKILKCLNLLLLLLRLYVIWKKNEKSYAIVLIANLIIIVKNWKQLNIWNWEMVQQIAQYQFVDYKLPIKMYCCEE